MLRALLFALALANLGFYAWSRGWLDGVSGIRAHGDREPERLARQVRPDVLKILPPDSVASKPPVAASAASASASAPPEPPAPLACLEAGPFTAAQLASAEAAVQAAVPRGQWNSLPIDRPGQWIVYMGRYASRDQLLKKEDELRRRKVEFAEVTAPAELEPGLDLGRFGERALAEVALAQFNQQAIHTARVVALAPPTKVVLLQVQQADAALASQLTALRSDALGAGFVPCAPR